MIARHNPALKVAATDVEPTILSDEDQLPYVLQLQQQIDEAFNNKTPGTSGTTSAYLLRETLESIMQGVLMFDTEHRVRIWNQRAIDLLDLPLELFQSHPTMDAIMTYQQSLADFAPEDLTGIQALRDADHAQKPLIIERRRRDGRILKVQSIPLQMGGFVRTFTDVTEARAQQAQLLAAEREFRQLYQNATIGIYRASVDGQIIWSNPALVALNGFETEQELIASVVDDASEWYTQAGRGDEFRHVMFRDGKVVEFESEVYLVRKKQKIWVSENAWLVRDDSGKPAYFEGTVLDVTARKQSEARLEHLVDHDGLTDLLNRHAFERQLNIALAGGHPVALAILDLDGFKLINDQFGHEAGDVVLSTTARRIRSIAHQNIAAARFGGDEFAVLIDMTDNKTDLAELAADLVKAIGEPIRVGARLSSVGVSIGMAKGPQDGKTAIELIRRADNALYAAKNNGKNTFRFFDSSMLIEWQETIEMERDLRAALHSKKLRMAYQPIVLVQNGQVTSREALLRWHDSKRGHISPGDFVPFAERQGLIHQLDRYVIEQVCHEAAQLPDNMPVAINISATEFASEDFFHTVRAALNASGLPAHRLEIEVTESAVLNDDASTSRTMAQLRALGIRLALDDFGAGYSALINLKKYAFDKIKIDQFFLRNSAANAVDIAILKAMIGLGNEIGVPVVVEGVETVEHHQLLKSLNCPYAQGYLFGKPAFLS
jgi:diguanylate cyclase (GGDEF)-like protein/PAS domain S-box-containing protein